MRFSGFASYRIAMTVQCKNFLQFFPLQSLQLRGEFWKDMIFLDNIKMFGSVVLRLRRYSQRYIFVFALRSAHSCSCLLSHLKCCDIQISASNLAKYRLENKRDNYHLKCCVTSFFFLVSSRYHIENIFLLIPLISFHSFSNRNCTNF